MPEAAKFDRDELALAFLRHVLPPEGSGFYCLWTKSNKRNLFAETIDDFWGQIKEHDQNPRENVYFALAAFKDNSNRKTYNAIALKAFIADLDIDLGKAAKGAGYSTLKEAGDAVRNFLKATALPTPMVVSSGHGVHLYWPLRAQLPTAEWKFLAEKMKRLFAQHGLRADPAVTGDVVRVLRVPGTTNRKPGRAPVEVSMPPAYLTIEPYDLNQFHAVLDEITLARSDNVIRLKFGPVPDYLKKVSGWGLTEAGRIAGSSCDADALLIAEGCAQIRHMRDTRGLLTEPEWHHSIGVIARCNCPAIAHEWSKGDERYNAAETQAKIERALKETTGPTKCETFIGLDNGRCEGCPSRGKIASPIELGRAPPPSPEESAGIFKWALTQKGGIREMYYPNAEIAIEYLRLECQHDVFHDRKFIEGPMLGRRSELSDAVARAVRSEIIEQLGFDPGGPNVLNALEEACEHNRFDPVANYLDALIWDRQPRVDHWLTTYIGADDTRLNQALGRKTLLAAVRRVRQPGCKFDFMLVLEGPQGAGKSTAIRILGGDENFSDQALRVQDPQRQQEAVAGVWFYEFAELESIRKVDVETTKTFLSRTSDNVRPAYGRFRVDRPRRCIFIGTTNAGKHDGWLHDPTGNRRFWPVECGTIELMALRRDRDQLFAEAVQIEAAGEPLSLPEHLFGEIIAQQEARQIEDGWTDLLAIVKGTIFDLEEGAEERISSRDLLTQYLNLTGAQIRDYHGKRLGRVMRRLGWQGPKYIRVISSGPTVRGYYRALSNDTPS